MKRSVITALILALLLSSTVFSVPETLIPGGQTVGIELFTDGLLVTGVIPGSPAEAAGLRENDRLLLADANRLTSVQQLQQLCQTGEPVVLSVDRDGLQAEFLLLPEKTENGYRLGLYLRDHIAGIGTVTYYDPESDTFGALGHGVSDPAGGELLPVSAGILVPSAVIDVVKGKPGFPGILRGSFDPTVVVGTISKNSEHGIFGSLTQQPELPPIPVAGSGEIRTGSAQILSNISGTAVALYSVRIDKLSPDAKNGRNILLTVTDETLLSQTGGIIQGMSGSPILQNGKIVGAVTHVLVNRPEVGYGIFIENMLDEAD